MGNAKSRIIEPSDYAAMIKRCLVAMGRRAGDADCESLRIFGELREQIDLAEHRAMAALIDEGYSLRDMARALGVNVSAVHKRYHRHTNRDDVSVTLAT